MVRKIVWSDEAKNDLKQILEFWAFHNQSYKYSKKLGLIFKETIVSLSKNSGIGFPSDLENTRIKIVKEYLIIYEVTNKIIILSIFDSRRKPSILTKRK